MIASGSLLGWDLAQLTLPGHHGSLIPDRDRAPLGALSEVAGTCGTASCAVHEARWLPWRSTWPDGLVEATVQRAGSQRPAA